MMLLHEYLSRSADLAPGKTALVCGNSRYTYRELASAADALNGHFAASGLLRGDRIVIFLENSFEAVVAIFGSLRAGGCIVVVNPATTPERLGYIMRNCGAKFLITSVEKLEKVQTAERLCSARPLMLLAGTSGDVNGAMSFERVLSDHHGVSPSYMIDTDLAAIIYTSGSTGSPKGVTHLHRSVDTAVDAIIEYLHNSNEDIILNTLALSSSYGLLQLLATVKTGATLVLEKGFGLPYDIVKRIHEEKVTGFAGSPTMFAILLRLEETAGGTFPSLRYITNAAAAMPASFVPRLRKMFPATQIYLMHGCTECFRTTYLPPGEVETRPTSVGRGMTNVELWIADADGNPAPIGETGEMMVRGSTLMAGYWNDPESTAKALRPGRYPWEKSLRTGDLFRMDEDGYFYFVARSDEIIKSKGEKVSPVEVEDVILRLSAVMEVRVIGVPDDILGQAIQAEIVLKENKTLTPEEVKRHCREFLEDFKVPRFVKFTASLPKTMGGKIKRSADTR